MDNVLFSIGSLTVFKSAVVITLGVLICSALGTMLYKNKTGSAAPVIAFLPIAYLLSVVFARLLHWYFTEFAYKNFWQAITDFSVGSFALAGVIIGVWLAAFIVTKLGSVESKGTLLDCFAPGICLLVAFVRLGCFWTGSCIGNRNIESALLKWKPLAVTVTDNAGNVDYKLRVYFMEAVLMIVLALVLLVLLKKLAETQMHSPCSQDGNVARIFLVLFSVIEVVIDSLRNDSILMRFRFLHQMNPYSSFISLAQIFSLILLICVFVYYLSKSIKIYGFDRGHLGAIILFLICGAMMGATGEFCIQRFGSIRFLLTVRTWGYISMLSGAFFMVRLILKQYRSCVR